MNPEDPAPVVPMARRIDAFRGTRAPSRPLHPAEKLLLWILGAHLCFLPWALGTMHPWPQSISAALAVFTLAVAVVPREYGIELSGSSPPFRLMPWRKLARFPIFWLGLGLVIYVALQALNPSWRYVQAQGRWWLVRIPNLHWSPTGVAAPFLQFNPWRDVLVYASCWLTTCGVWVGLTRRRSLRILLFIVTINGLAVGGLLAAQHVAHDFRIPWPLTAWTPSPLVASFIYKNHAGAYFALAAFAAIALASWHSDDGVRRLRKSTPGAVLGMASVFLGIAVLFTLSRGASLTLSLGVGLYFGWFFLRRRRLSMAVGTNPAVAWIVAAVLMVFALVALHYMDFSLVFSRFDAMAIQGMREDSVESRTLIHAASRDMLRDHWLRGLGAGGFRYFSPEYVRHYPAIYQGGALYWDHAHSDWLEFPIELGLVGDLILLSGSAWWIGWFVRRKTLWHPLAVPLLLGCSQTLVHAGFDFPFQCPAILITWLVLLAIAGRAVEMKG